MTPTNITEILRHKQFSFSKLLLYRLQMVLAYQTIAVTAGWHIYEITLDPLALGLIGLAEALPYFCTALFAGYAVDHYSRRWFGVLAALMLVFNAATLTAVSMGVLHGDVAWWIYGSIAVTGLARAFIAPTYSSLFAIIFPRTVYAKASGLGTSVFQFGLIAGPALGGLVVAYSGKTAAYGLAALLFFGAACALFSLNIKHPPAAETAPVFKSIAEGLRFVVNNQVLFGAQMLDMFAVLFGGAVAMLPAFIHDIYHLGAESLGILRAAPAVGAVLVSLLLARYSLERNTGYWLLAMVAGFGLCIIAFGLNTNFYAAIALLFLSGCFDGVSVVLRATIMQLATPDHMRGRVSAINGVFIGSSNELGAFESGVAARLMGLVPSVVFGGAMTLMVVGVTAKFAPKLRQLELHQLH